MCRKGHSWTRSCDHEPGEDPAATEAAPAPVIYIGHALAKLLRVWGAARTDMGFLVLLKGPNPKVHSSGSGSITEPPRNLGVCSRLYLLVLSAWGLLKLPALRKGPQFHLCLPAASYHLPLFHSSEISSKSSAFVWETPNFGICLHEFLLVAALWVVGFYNKDGYTKTWPCWKPTRSCCSSTCSGPDSGFRTGGVNASNSQSFLRTITILK